MLCGFCLAEVKSRSVASAWPRSGRALWLLRGRGQVVLCGFCVAEVRSCSVASAWPRSSRALGLLLGRGHLVLSGVCLAEVRSSSVASPASPVPCTVSSGSRGPTSSRPGVLLVFVLSGVCFSSVLRCSFLFSVVHCGSGILVGWALGSSHCCSREYCHRLNRYVSWRWRVFIVSGHAVSRPTAMFRFWLPLPRCIAPQQFLQFSIGVTSGVSVDLTSSESVFEVLVSAGVLLARFMLVFFGF